MLQQTQVDRVIPRFSAFIARWPTVEALAAAAPIDVLAMWSGLGYNARAKRLHEAAQMVADEGWPTTVEGLRKLPGVGPYTAAAIASIAFGVTIPAVDTNLRRVLGRWEGSPLTGAALARVAEEVVGRPAGDWNQALMDLGATICRPAAPRCDQCPVASWCADPTVYLPPPRQGRFEGSSRQLRGAVVRAHIAGEDPVAAGQAIGHGRSDILEVIEQLQAEGMLPANAGRSDTTPS
jgi:A/G-specific adenine glycosylase